MKKENKIHLEWAKVYWPQDYEVVDELKELKEENKKLREEIRFLEECLDNKEKVNKKLREELSAYDREYFDEDKKAKNIFMEEDTLQ